MNILETIIASKENEVAARKQQVSLSGLMDQELFHRQPFSLKKFLLNPEKTGIIAEFKRKSPSKGIINASADVVDVTEAYSNNGASCLSILTDEIYFGGHTNDLMRARKNQLPILRKDFIIDPYQIAEARAIGADVILLIAACLTIQQVKELSAYAQSLHLEVLLELHDETELEHISELNEIVGINNRSLKTFKVDVERSLRMAEMLPAGIIKVAESGISSVDDLLRFKQNGYRGFLIGENFMKQNDPGAAFVSFVNQLNNSQ